MKQAVDEARFDKIYCFETRHGELWSTALEGLFVPVVGQVLAVRAMYRLLTRRFIVYLYKFKNGEDEFFITFKKREDKTFRQKPTPKIEDFDITLSQIPSSKNGDDYVAVPLKYEYDHASGVITYPYFVNVASSRRDVRAIITNEVYSPIRPQEHSNMIITKDMTQQLTDMEVSPIMKAVGAIKKVNYSECLDRQKKFSDYLFNIRKRQPHRDLDDVAQEFDNAYYDLDKFVEGYSSNKGGSAKKNKYTSRIISRKRRLSGKKGRKCRKSYKNVKSRKMARR